MATPRRWAKLLAIHAILSALLPGCRCKPDGPASDRAAPAATASTQGGAPSAAPSAKELAPPPPEATRPPGRRGADLQALLCRDRPQCTVLSRTPAGKDPRSGRDRLLVAIRIGEPAADRDEDCVPHEEWLVVQSGGTFEVDQFLIADCSREPEWPVELRVAENTASFNLGGTVVPSNWIGTVIVLAELSPPRLSRREWNYFFRLEGCHDENGWRNMNGFASEIVWRREAGPGEAADGGCTLPRAFVPVPVVALPAEFEAGGWKTTALGDCAARIDGTKANGGGYTVSGSTNGPSDGSMSTVMSSAGVLYVEIADDHLTSEPPPGNSAASSAPPSQGDQVQIFRSPEFDNNSLSPPVKLPKPARWDVRVADGRVLRAVNASASALQVDRSDDRGRVRLRVRFVRVTPADLLAGALAIAFGDADPGEPDAIIATSQAPLGHPSNLGRMERLDQNVACRVDASSLVWPVAPGERESPLYRYTD